MILPDVNPTYENGMTTSKASFQTSAPAREEWDKGGFKFLMQRLLSKLMV